MVPPKPLRCAIYTRVSDDAGLEQDFNSLDAQREASEAYIKSQAHEGWRLIPTSYADGGFSGGSMERPALLQLLADIRAGGIDIILVYKVDRLTRSLADFAKLVEIFDQYGTSFVSVTQAFNTTNSMGRLTLNVLLSFAQFEREVTAERIRDKIAASKKKGIWMGGHPPLGYQVEKRKLLIEPGEADVVRNIFKRYLELGSMLPLLTELHRGGVTTRPRILSSGKAVGGIPFTKGPLNHLLKNRTYIGELNHRDKSYPGEHLGIVDRKLFDAVQARLSSNLQVSRIRRRATGALLAGKIYDDRGNRMTPTYSKKNGARYHYYACRLLIEGRRAEAGAVHRVPAAEVDEQVINALKSPGNMQRPGEPWSDREFQRQSVESLVTKVVVDKHQIVVALTNEAAEHLGQAEIVIPWAPKPGRPKREILLPHSDATKDQRPIKTEVRTHIVRAVALGRRWLGELVSGEVGDTEALARRESRSRRSIHMLISLAFVAPDIIEALIEGKLPRGIGITKLVDLSPNWSDQREVLGVAKLSSGETKQLPA
jgi:DNA invertase Pin-like site-specific DNA recombinase